MVMAAEPAILLIGLSAGAEVDLLAYLISRYFGMRHYAKDLWLGPLRLQRGRWDRPNIQRLGA